MIASDMPAGFRVIIERSDGFGMEPVDAYVALQMAIEKIKPQVKTQKEIMQKEGLI